jgi:hypothetical protein
MFYIPLLSLKVEMDLENRKQTPSLALSIPEQNQTCIKKSKKSEREGILG